MKNDFDIAKEIASNFDVDVVFSSESRGLGYLCGALFDPFITSSQSQMIKLFFDLSELKKNDWPANISFGAKRKAQKERISFESSYDESIPIYNSLDFTPVNPDGDWKILAKIAELPAVASNKGVAVFSFNPCELVCKYLNMAEPVSTADLIDIIVKSVLLARGDEAIWDNNDLRRDFHALGVSFFMLSKLYALNNCDLDMRLLDNQLKAASKSYRKKDFNAAKKLLKECFNILEKERNKIFSIPIYFMNMPHGGILFDDSGFAEYDWPEVAAKVLRLFLHWTKSSSYTFAPDIGAGTLENLAANYPETINELKKAWDEGAIEFVNGTYSQPYLQMWPEEDQILNFEEGLKVFDKFFGRRPSCYAAQEIALHPNLPSILKKFGFKSAIHRVQNLGTAPLDENPIINWRSNKGDSIRALPSNFPMSEKMGTRNYSELPELISKCSQCDLPFLAITNFIDQTFVGVYQEEIIRSSGYCSLWGEFLTPSQFFERTKDFEARDVYYSLDDYSYNLEIVPESNYHRYETGGLSSSHAYWNAASKDIKNKKVSDSDGEIKRLLEGQAHDSYILPYFKTGAFMELYLHDYDGPRYKVVHDGPRGANGYICDKTELGFGVEDLPDFSPAPCEVMKNGLKNEYIQICINPEDASITQINENNACMGRVDLNGKSVSDVRFVKDEFALTAKGFVDDFGEVELKYFLNDKRCFCILRALNNRRWNYKLSYWKDCLSIAFRKERDSEIIRHSSGVFETTRLPEFFSLDKITIASKDNKFDIGIGGNIFFRQDQGAVYNRLWSYGETAKSFWWSVEAKKN